MMKVFILVLSFSFLAQASVVDSVPLTCGYSDFMFSQIPQWTQEKSTMNEALKGKQGETGRRFIMYSDQSWILTFEYFSNDETNYDLSCVVRKGLKDEAYDGMSSLIDSLPAERVGPRLRSEDEARLILQ